MADSDAPRPAFASESATATVRPITPLKSALATLPAGETKTLCERCGAEMYRMHAVWRCSICGFKTDCCGW
jgi:rubrerythrin